MRKITLPLYLICLSLYGVFVVGLAILFGGNSIVDALGGSSPQSGTLSEMLVNVADWFTGPIASGLITIVFFALSLVIALMTLILGFNFAFGRGVHSSSPSTLTGVDSLLSFLEPFLPTRTMNEVAGDVRERIGLLHDQGASPWRVRHQLATGLLFILLDAAREALASRRKKRG